MDSLRSRIGAGSLAVMLSVLSLMCGSGSDEPKTAIPNGTEETYVCPMHPEITSDKPGNCRKCGMDLVRRAKESLPGDDRADSGEKINQPRILLDEVKRELDKGGEYACCIKDPCDRCALDHESCECAAELKSGNAVCSDCFAGWQRGDGTVQGITAGEVKGGFHSHQH